MKKKKREKADILRKHLKRTNRSKAIRVSRKKIKFKNIGFMAGDVQPSKQKHYTKVFKKTAA